MSMNSNIGWCDDSGSPWNGCTKIAPECADCWAAEMAARFGTAEWGPRAERPIRIDAFIRDMQRIARRGDRDGRPRRVFIGSTCDVLEDRPELAHPRSLMFEALDEINGRLIAMFLTKRIENAGRMLPAHWLDTPPPWAWWGVSAGTQDRWTSEVGKLLRHPSAVRYVSVEPMLVPIDWPGDDTPEGFWSHLDGLVHGGFGAMGPTHEDGTLDAGALLRVDWAIIGGMTGPNWMSNQLDLAGAERFAAACVNAGVATFVKQDSHRFPGRRGRLSDWMWSLKQFPMEAA